MTVILAPLNEAFLGISQGPSATLRHNQPPGHIAAGPATWRYLDKLDNHLTLTRTGLASRQQADDDFSGHTTRCWAALRQPT